MANERNVHLPGTVASPAGEKRGAFIANYSELMSGVSTPRPRLCSGRAAPAPPCAIFATVTDHPQRAAAFVNKQNRKITIIVKVVCATRHFALFS